MQTLLNPRQAAQARTRRYARKKVEAREERYAREGRRQNLMSSSVVEEMHWFQEEHKIWVRLGWRWYTYLNIPGEIFHGWKEGNAMCMTSDPTGRMRWYVLKTPSLGAFYNGFIKGRYISSNGRN